MVPELSKMENLDFFWLWVIKGTQVTKKDEEGTKHKLLDTYKLQIP